MIDKDKKITIAQAVNISVQLAIAQKGKDVTVSDVRKLIKEVYITLFKQEAAEVYRATENKIEPKTSRSSVEDFIIAYTSATDKVKFRNDNLEIIKSFSKDEQNYILESVKASK